MIGIASCAREVKAPDKGKTTNGRVCSLVICWACVTILMDAQGNNPRGPITMHKEDAENGDS
eukprot:scaffold528583_cov17-Prasinocladus_malaysianus.AAC.1